MRRLNLVKYNNPLKKSFTCRFNYLNVLLEETSTNLLPQKQSFNYTAEMPEVKGIRLNCSNPVSEVGVGFQKTFLIPVQNVSLKLASPVEFYPGEKEKNL